MVDVHCHLQFHSFKDDFDAVAKRAFDAGVTKIINVGTKIDSSQKAVELAKQYEKMYAIIGVHPHHADKIGIPHPTPLLQGEREKLFKEVPSPLMGEGEDEGEKSDNWIKQLEKLAQYPKVIGIGEIGMDFFSYKSNGIVDPALQKRIFIQQIEIAHRLKLPLQIHNRQAGKEILEILTYYKDLLQSPPGMFHCFAGSMDILKSALEMGFYIGFDGNVTYKGLAPGETTELKDLAIYTPIDRLVVETDSPFLTPVPYRGERNEPQYVIITGQFLAELKGIPFDSFTQQTTKNVYTIFSNLGNPNVSE